MRKGSYFFINSKMSLVVGSIIWARFDGFVFWPSILTEEGDSRIKSFNLNSILTMFSYKDGDRFVSVVFLADKGRTATKIHRDRIIPFEGKEKYWAYAEDQKVEKKVCV